MIGEWLDIGWVGEIPVRGSRVVKVTGGEDIAVFRTGEGKVFALRDRCPHKHGRLSQGIVHGGAVACPLHNWRISLSSGEALRARFLYSQSFSQDDPWAERAAGAAREQHAHMAHFHPNSAE